MPSARFLFAGCEITRVSEHACDIAAVALYRSFSDYCTVSVAVPVTPATDAEIVVVPEATP